MLLLGEAAFDVCRRQDGLSKAGYENGYSNYVR